MKKLRFIPRFFALSLLLDLALTGFYFIYEGLPIYLRAPGSLLLAPIALADGLCYALGLPGIYGRPLPIFLVNLFVSVVLVGVGMALFRRRRSWLDSPGRRRMTGKRPIAVTVIAWAIFILFLVRLYQVFEPLVLSGVFETGFRGALFDGLLPTKLGVAVFTSAAYALLSISGIVVLISFLRMRRWSWVILMVWTFISLTISLFDYFYAEPNYIVMASDTIIAFALNQADVQRIFRIRTDPGERLD